MKNESKSEKISTECDFCKDVKENLSAFVDGELPKEQIVKICDHLLDCENCKILYKNLRQTQKSLRNYFNTASVSPTCFSDNFGETIVNKVIFAQRQKRIIYFIAAITLIAGAGYFSLNFIHTYPEAVNKVKYTEKKPAITPVSNTPEKNTKEITEKLNLKK